MCCLSSLILDNNMIMLLDLNIFRNILLIALTFDHPKNHCLNNPSYMAFLKNANMY